METRANDVPTTEALRRRGRARRRRIALGAALVVASLFAWYFDGPLFRGNLGVVDPGLVYRSAQPFGDVEALIRRHELGSVLNLRGGKDDDPWYRAEVDATRRAEVEFFDVPLSAVRRPSRRELLTILDVLDRCHYPLLIHCKSGSDRTGLVAGLYRMYRRGVPPGEAEGSFSLAFGHVPLLGPERLHEPFDEYAAWLADSRLGHTPARLVDWVAHHYRADDPLADLTPVSPGPRSRRRR